MEEEMITITLKEYNKLIENDAFMDALVAAGVDNWDGYDEAKDLLEEWNS